MSISWLEAWRLWFSGKPLTGTHLWGLNIIWWGRIGKILEFVAAYSIITEIVGERRLREYGKSLRNLIPKKTISNTLRSAWDWTWANLRYSLFRGSSEARKRASEEMDQNPRITRIDFFAAVALALLTIFFLVQTGKGEIWSYVVGALVLFWLYDIIVIPLLMCAFLWLINIVGNSVDIVFFRSMANVLEYTKLENAVRLGSLVVLAVGFQFDLLAT